jgi:internalin A
MARNVTYERAEGKIEEARQSRAKDLTLQLGFLTELPESLGQLTHLQSLDVADNELTALPESLGRLTHLQSLNLNNNQLTALPESLGQLTQLQSLNLNNNQLTALPESLGQLTQLQSLNLAHNNLTVLPESLGQLTQLQSLDVYVNDLTALPESLGQLTQLRWLDVAGNDLTALPESLGQLTQLRELSLSVNPIVSLPRTAGALKNLQSLTLAQTKLKHPAAALGELTGLQYLVLSHTPLTRLPAWIGNLRNLKGLNLSKNGAVVLKWAGSYAFWNKTFSGVYPSLVDLPDSIKQLSLEELYLHGNEELGIPPEVLGADWASVRRRREVKPTNPRAILDWYFRSRAEPTQRLNEAKMLLVGQGGVGKTSLVHYLIRNKPCDHAELPTEGINIDDWDIQGTKDADGKFERVKVHVWDFGGQEIMHATHQFFLTRRSLYLLVIDARAGEKESNIHYWLKIIQSYGGDSPVLVVVNKCDQHPHELNETSLMRDYPNIRGFIQTSCADGQGIATLRRAVGKHVRKLPHVFDELPISYFAVKGELELVAAARTYMPIEDYRQICARHTVEKPENQDRLIRFLHDLGVVLNFQDPDDPYGQNDPFVLNPEWVTDGVYAIVNDKLLKAKRDGLLTREELGAVLNALDGYPLNRHDFIVRKMMQFELAYQIGHGKETRWLIPELLDPNEPKSLQWRPTESLNFQYSYPVLPAGVICRFIVRMHQHVDRKRSWRSGTVLSIDGATVLVRGDIEKNKAFIAVQGAVNQRKEHLALVRDAFRYVHSTIPALGPKEEVPLPDNPAVAVPYDYLLTLDGLGQRSFVPIGADRLYSVTELMNGVDSVRYQVERRNRMLMEEGEMSEKHVFISYCRDNKDEVARLIKDLENAGETVWWDEDILAGRDWKEAIREAMRNAFAVVVCLSPEFTERYRSGVYPELRDAIATFRQYGPGHSYIFPVRLADCQVPSIEIDDTRTLERIQHIDLFPESKRNAALRKLVESLTAAPRHP